MKYLFADNFRGFTGTLLSIKDVNFFVGENSTGKTSIIGLLKILGSPYFWFTGSFSADEVKLGYFKDIVSINSPDKSYFRVGVIETIEAGKGEADLPYDAFLITFIEKEGMPVISRYTFIDGNQQVEVIFGPKIIKYKYGDLSDISNTSEFIENVFPSWINSHQKDELGYKTLKGSSPILRRGNLVFLSAFVKSFSKKKSQISSERLLHFPGTTFDITWLAPIRTKPKRTYDEYKLDFSAEGEHTPYLIRRLLSNRAKSAKFSQYVRKYGEASGLFESVSVKKYGQSATSPFELDVILSNEALNIGNVGYGVSQALPIVVEIFASSQNAFAIQQPEIHLHPRAQAALGDLFFNLAVMEEKKFIIETHSDFMIDRFRLNYRRENLANKPDAQIVFFERNAQGNKLYPIDILENGELPDTQPAAYREFFVREQLDLLDL